MKFVVDVNLSKLWVTALEGAGHEAHYWADLGRADDNDEVIMQWARVNSAHILKCDLDFSAILAASGAARPSVMQFRPGRHLPQKLMGKLMIACECMKKRWIMARLLQLITAIPGYAFCHSVKTG